MKDKITVIGSLNYDIILKISRLPYKGETLPANDAAYSAGGKVQIRQFRQQNFIHRHIWLDV